LSINMKYTVKMAENGCELLFFLTKKK